MAHTLHDCCAGFTTTVVNNKTVYVMPSLEQFPRGSKWTCPVCGDRWVAKHVRYKDYNVKALEFKRSRRRWWLLWVA